MNQDIHDLIKYIAKYEREIIVSRKQYHKAKNLLKEAIQELSDTYHVDQNIKFELLRENIDKLILLNETKKEVKDEEKDYVSN